MSQYFELFQLPPTYNIDTTELNHRYHNLATHFHPDKFATASSFEQRQAMMMASTLNEAYRTLSQPADRAAYLLQSHGIDADDPTHTTFAPEFLMQQMEWREALEDASNNSTALNTLDHTIATEQEALNQALITAFDKEDFQNAAEHVRRYRFMNKLRQEIQARLP